MPSASDCDQFPFQALLWVDEIGLLAVGLLLEHEVDRLAFLCSG